MTAKSNTVPPPVKRARLASVTYPYHPLNLCVDLAKAVREIGNGKGEVSRKLIASHMNVDEGSSDFAQKLASAKYYGLIDGRSAYTLTEISRALFYPTHDPEKERKVALLKAVQTPEAFIELLRKYDGSRPHSPELIGNVLHSEMGIPDSWKQRVATFFLRSLEYAGALSTDGFIRHGAELEKLEHHSSHDHPRKDTHIDHSVPQPLCPSPKTIFLKDF